MKRRTALRLYKFLFILQVIALFTGSVRLVSRLIVGDVAYLIPCLVGAVMGFALAVLWYREWKAIEAVSDEQWNRAWFIQPSKKA